MGRHRNEPLGLAARILAGLAIVAALVGAVVGIRALAASPVEPPAIVPLAEMSPVRTPTVRIECLSPTCATVTVRVPAGDVLVHRDMAEGEQVSFYDDELSVVLKDSGAVLVEENGVPRPRGKAGERETFTVERS
ncbi:hypothetical protein [Nonomuraea soli]|uniref:DUF4115 domain-containing protein n=1 Tax=Nonomuraea soli TaxID=1032476 RepID=A0A7W0CIF8_9ACTN|nr:hypothetical protein [Nonomuraea soli]MBA2891545.1 hypothetical protein [Nonomuraea soli]